MTVEKPKYQVKTALQCITDHSWFHFLSAGSQLLVQGMPAANSGCYLL